MFTGLVQHLGRIESRSPTPSGASLWVSLEAWDHRPDPGASISVAGCCLTVADRRPAGERIEAVRFDVVPQTLERTTIGRLDVGDRVNLEPSATPATLLGGHLVQGHVDEVGRVLSIATEGEWRVRIGVGASFAPLLVPRGSIAVEGVSLTIAELGPDWFEVALIPETLERTTLGDLKAGDGVNLEGDCIAKMVVRVLETRVGGDLRGAVDAIGRNASPD
ncbi:MAG: riboflavin synthase [Planctomycetota bacterium]|jgi:riboflavin synthase